MAAVCQPSLGCWSGEPLLSENLLPGTLKKAAVVHSRPLQGIRSDADPLRDIRCCLAPSCPLLPHATAAGYTKPHPHTQTSPKPLRPCKGVPGLETQNFPFLWIWPPLLIQSLRLFIIPGVTSPRCIPVASPGSLSSLPAAGVLLCFFRPPGSRPRNPSTGQVPFLTNSLTSELDCFTLLASFLKASLRGPALVTRTASLTMQGDSPALSQASFLKLAVLTHLPGPGWLNFLLCPAAQAVPRAQPPAPGCGSAPLWPELCSED